MSTTDEADIAKLWTAKGDLCNPAEIRKAEDGLAGVGVGLANLVGLGFLVDPMSPLQSKLSDNQATIQNIYNSSLVTFVKDQSSMNKKIVEALQSNQQEIQSFINLHDELIDENITKVDISLVFISLMSLVIVIYILIS